MLSKMKMVIFWAVIAYPATWFLQVVFKIPIFNEYKEILGLFYTAFYSWWDWMLIALFSYLVTRDIINIKYETMEKIRSTRLVTEMERWIETPYIPPIMAYYLINPPQAVSTDIRIVVDNRFYQRVITFFRDRIYINASFSSLDPLERDSNIKNIGYKDLATLIAAFSFVLGWFGAITLTDPSKWVYGWERFSIPLVLYLSLYTSMKLQAIMEMRYSKLDKVLTKHFGEAEPHYRWREFFPDQPKGEILLLAWRAECEKRQRYTNMLHGGHMEVQQYTNPALAPYPYPSQELPHWIDELDNYYADKMDLMANSEPKTIPLKKKNKQQNNVVNFKRK
ncbi:hypothetical protein [Cytobacillus firmus]|uniref:Uncharacterized protein n=1 Tax=Cytobacillus firmus DS1 TaxID=1307436 RepID=W7KMU6_CYTFI|nr:hypothetical protein [Cytobacillus firmus]EWG08720.1 hypothetical protein PBF_22819 [Cytobacillus firmus DS1]